MDGLTLLAEARAAGLTVRAEGGRLLVRGPQDREALARRLLDRKAELLGLLRVSAPWDQAAAERLLAELRAEVRRVEAVDFAGRPPAALANVLADALALGERYVREHELAAARGWDALQLLRGLLPQVRQCAAHARQLQAEGRL